MKFDFKNILIGVVIGVFGTTSVFLIVGDVDIQTDFQFGEKLDQDDMDISISIEKKLKRLRYKEEQKRLENKKKAKK